MTRLIMRRGPNPGRVFELNSEIVTIGSGSKNNIVILDNDVSREHCRLIRVMADYELQDMESVRGTFVSGQRVKNGWLLKPGSFIELGENITLEYARDSAGIELDRVPVEPTVVSPDKPPANAHPYLVMQVGPRPGHVYPLQSRIVNIGRDLSNDIVVQDPEISRFHVTLRWTDTAYQIEDLGSTNGTLLSGNPLPAKEPKTLHSNDVIQIATMVELRYTWQPDDIRMDAPKTSRSGGTGQSKGTTKDLAQIDTAEAKILGAKDKLQTSKLGTGLQPGALVDHVFVTYAREEWETIVAPLAVILQDHSYNVWVDQYLTQGEDDWMLAVEQALSECWLLIVVVSPEAVESRYVKLAYRYFFNREKPIIPLLYSGVTDLPLELKNLKVIRYDSQDRKKTFEELVAEMQVDASPDQIPRKIHPDFTFVTDALGTSRVQL